MKLKQFLRFLILIICSFYLSLSDESWSHTSSHKRNLCSFLRRREYHQWAILGFSRCSRELSIINFWALLLLWICTDFGISVNFGDLVKYILKSKRQENILETWICILKPWAPTCLSWRLCSSKSSFIPSKSSGAWISANFVRFNERLTRRHKKQHD